jgi:hypothetical protein
MGDGRGPSFIKNIGSCSGQVEVDNRRDETGRDAFMIDGQLMDSGLAGQIGLVNSTVGAQEVAQTIPVAYRRLPMPAGGFIPS